MGKREELEREERLLSSETGTLGTIVEVMKKELISKNKQLETMMEEFAEIVIKIKDYKKDIQEATDRYDEVKDKWINLRYELLDLQGNE